MTIIESRISKTIIIVSFFCNSFFSKAQNNSNTVTVTLKEVVLNSPKTSTALNKLPFAVSFQEVEQYQNIFQQITLQDYLRSVPGLFTQNANNYAQDLRVSLRGFGARSAFGIRGVKIIVDGIPETTPDGQGQIDNIPLGLLKNLEVLRGPSASLYGNASGGVIYLNTIDYIEGKNFQFRTRLGAFGLQSYQLTGSVKNDKTTALIHANRLLIAGFRNNSGLEQNLFNLKIKHKLNPSSKIQFQMNYTESPRAEDAGGITLEDSEQNRSQARQRNLDYDTYESVNHFKIGLNWDKSWTDKVILSTYGFYSFRDFYGKLPFENGGIIDLKRNYFGLGSRLNYKIGKNNLQVAAELLDQSDQRDRYLNILGSQGSISFSQKEKFQNLSFSILDELKLEKLFFRLSLRYDDMRLGTDGFSQDQFYQVINPSLGVSLELAPYQNLYANFSTSFETPALSELSANPSGAEGFNIELSPSEAISYELGWKGRWQKFKLESNLFLIESSNEILPYELEEFPGRSFYRNTGATQRYGLEVTALYKYAKWDASLSVTQAKYSFKDVNNNLGNALPGIPNSQIFLQLGYTLKNSLQLLVSAEHIGDLYANNSNTVKVDSFRRVRFQIGKTLNFDKLEISFSGGINNLFNERYFDNIRLNAFGKRFYEPAPGRNVYFGLQIGI